MRRIPMLTLLVLVLAGWTLPAHAAPTRLRLTDYTVTPRAGLVSVEASFSGLEGRERPGPGDYPFVLDASGTVKVIRTYGCQTLEGQRLRRYDRKVTGTHSLFFPTPGRPVPDGDTVTFAVYALLPDAQPRNCPVGTQPTIYAVQAKQVRFELTSQWAAIPSATYALRGRTVWHGEVLAPALAG